MCSSSGRVLVCLLKDKVPRELGMVAHVYNSSIQVVEAGGPRGQHEMLYLH